MVSNHSQAIIYMSSIKQLSKYLCPISGFFNAITDSRPEVEHHEDRNEIKLHSEFFKSTSKYFFLSEDITFSYQTILPFQDLRTHLQSSESEYMTICLFLKPESEINMSVNTRNYTLPGNSLIFFNNYSEYTIQEQEEEKREFLQIILTKKYIKNYINPDFVKGSLLNNIVNNKSNKILVLNQHNHILHHDMDDFLISINSDHHGEEFNLKLLKCVTEFIERFFKHQFSIDNYNTEEAEGNSVHLMRDFLDNNLSEGFIGIEKLASMFHMSVSTANRCFIKEFDRTPFNYFKDSQIAYSKQLLINTDMSISEIAFHLGNESVSNFIRTFKNATGMPPGLFRTKHTSENTIEANHY